MSTASAAEPAGYPVGRRGGREGHGWPAGLVFAGRSEPAALRGRPARRCSGYGRFARGPFRQPVRHLVGRDLPAVPAPVADALVRQRAAQVRVRTVQRPGAAVRGCAGPAGTVPGQHPDQHVLHQVLRVLAAQPDPAEPEGGEPDQVGAVLGGERRPVRGSRRRDGYGARASRNGRMSRLEQPVDHRVDHGRTLHVVHRPVPLAGADGLVQGPTPSLRREVANGGFPPVRAPACPAAPERLTLGLPRGTAAGRDRSAHPIVGHGRAATLLAAPGRRRC